MGMDLANKLGNEISWSNIAWAKLLALAEMYGWEPVGTTEPCDWTEPCNWDDSITPENPLPAWDGSYVHNDHPFVEPEDARAMADALEKALDDIPDHDGPDKMMTYRQGEKTGVLSIDLAISQLGLNIGPNYKLNLFEFFAGGDKDRLREFIQFCKQDGFFIY
jgi:hypothetical protein